MNREFWQLPTKILISKPRIIDALVIVVFIIAIIRLCCDNEYPIK